jgi:hypothetical protein
MTVNNTFSFTTSASFFTSFSASSSKSKTFSSAPAGYHTFLQTPLLWQQRTNNTKSLLPPIEAQAVVTAQQNNKSYKNSLSTALLKQQKEDATNAIIQQAMYILPKSPSNVFIHLQLPKFRSLSDFLRCDHVSQLVENWLCNPVEQLKRNSVGRRFQHDSRRLIMPSYKEIDCTLSGDEENNQLHVPATAITANNASKLFIHFQAIEQQITETMEIQFNNVPCLFTVICVTYHCGGSVSLSVNQVESLDFFMNNHFNPFSVKSDAEVPNRPVTVHPLLFNGCHYSRQQICDYAESDVFGVVSPSLAIVEQEAGENFVKLDSNNSIIQLSSIHDIDNQLNQVTIRHPEQEIKQDFINLPPSLRSSTVTEFVEYMHIKETLIYQQQEDDDESSYLLSSEEEEEEENVHTEEGDVAPSALLKLAQDTLEYIWKGNALSDELKGLERKLYEYCRLQTVQS